VLSGRRAFEGKFTLFIEVMLICPFIKANGGIARYDTAATVFIRRRK
jgi:hypothetical protein